MNIIDILGHPAVLHCNNKELTTIHLDKVGFAVPMQSDQELIAAWGDDIRIITIKNSSLKDDIQPMRYDRVEIGDTFYKIEEVSPVYRASAAPISNQKNGLLLGWSCLARETI